jgi:hypothetical protein
MRYSEYDVGTYWAETEERVAARARRAVDEYIAGSVEVM